jgi:hypothetical protein
MADQEIADRPGKLFSAQDSIRDAGAISPAEFGDELAEFAVVLVLFQVRVRLGVIGLQAKQFIGHCLPV